MKKLLLLVGILILALGCSSDPEIMYKEIIVTVEVEKIVEVEKNVVVEKIVEVQITPTPPPAPVAIPAIKTTPGITPTPTPPYQSNTTFWIGSKKSDVAKAQGSPAHISGNTWEFHTYSKQSWVSFGGTDELVIGWSDSSRILNLDPPLINPSIKTFWLGSDKYTVRVSQGNPYKIAPIRTWFYDEGWIKFNASGKVESWRQKDSQNPLKTGYNPPTKDTLTSDNLLICADNFITNDPVRCASFITDMQNSDQVLPQSLRAITQSAVEKLEKIGAEDHAKSFGGGLFSTPEIPAPTATPIPAIFTGKSGIFRYCKSETETTPEEASAWSGVKWRTEKFQVDKPWNVRYLGGPFLRITVFKFPEDQPSGTPPEYDEEGTRISRDGTIFASIVTSDKIINDSWSTDDTGSYFFEVQSMKGFCLVVE